MGKHMITKGTPGLQVSLTVLTLWHTIEAMLVGLISSGFVRVDSNMLFMFKCQILS